MNMILCYSQTKPLPGQLLIFRGVTAFVKIGHLSSYVTRTTPGSPACHRSSRLVTTPIAHFLWTLTAVPTVVLPWELMGRQGQNRSHNGLDTLGNRQSMTGEPGSSLEGHSSSRAPAAIHSGVDLKHRTNTILSPVHEVLTPVTSVTGTPRATFSALGSGGN
jgi:hypothetical protein